MSKAILILNMPKDCYECPLCVCDTEYDTICSALTIKAKDDYTNDVYELVTDEDWSAYRYSKCPLKPLPEKIDINGRYETDFTLNYYLSLKRNNVENAYEVGWNDCIDEIIGE